MMAWQSTRKRSQATSKVTNLKKMFIQYETSLCIFKHCEKLRNFQSYFGTDQILNLKEKKKESRQFNPFFKNERHLTG